MVQKLRLPIIILIIVVLNQAAGYAVHAAMPDSLLAGGTTRYAVADATALITTTSTTLVDMPGLVTSITIPAGKVGDVMVFFCGNVQSDSYASVSARVAGVTASPGVVQLNSAGAGGLQSQCVNFYRLGVPSGAKTVKMMWRGAGGAQQSLLHRSMIVIVNLH